MKLIHGCETWQKSCCFLRATARNHFSHLLEIRLHHKGHNTTTEFCSRSDSWLRLADQTDQSDVHRGTPTATPPRSSRVVTRILWHPITGNCLGLLTLCLWLHRCCYLEIASGCLPWFRAHFLFRHVRFDAYLSCADIDRRAAGLPEPAWLSYSMVAGYGDFSLVLGGKESSRTLGHAVAVAATDAFDIMSIHCWTRSIYQCMHWYQSLLPRLPRISVWQRSLAFVKAEFSSEWPAQKGFRWLYFDDNGRLWIVPKIRSYKSGLEVITSKMMNCINQLFHFPPWWRS